MVLMDYAEERCICGESIVTYIYVQSAKKDDVYHGHWDGDIFVKVRRKRGCRSMA